jgi:molecular chaperone GrpE
LFSAGLAVYIGSKGARVKDMTDDAINNKDSEKPLDADFEKADRPAAGESTANAEAEAGSTQDDQSSDGGQPQPSAELGEADAAAELVKVRDKLLRTVAEMENVRRRSQRDIENAHKFAVEKLLSDLLPVADSLEKAEESAKSTDDAASMAEGIRLSLKLFVSILEKSGVTTIDPLGEPFDPQLHEAMAMVPNPDAEPNSVMDVMQRGYTLNGRLVRAAKVMVVKGA